MKNIEKVFFMLLFLSFLFYSCNTDLENATNSATSVRNIPQLKTAPSIEKSTQVPLPSIKASSAGDIDTESIKISWSLDLTNTQKPDGNPIAASDVEIVLHYYPNTKRRPAPAIDKVIASKNSLRLTGADTEARLTNLSSNVDYYVAFTLTNSTAPTAVTSSTNANKFTTLNACKKEYYPTQTVEITSILIEEQARQGADIDLNCIDLINLDSINGIFLGYRNLKDLDISQWDTSNIVEMGNAFAYSDFNGDITNWDVSNVRSFASTFFNDLEFNQDISGWNVSSAENMSYMFSMTEISYDPSKRSKFNQDLSKWDVSKVKSMYAMFHYSVAFTSDLSEWDLRNVENLEGMFQSATNFNSDLNKWRFPKTTNLEDMFFNASSFNGNISSWEVGHVTNMKTMFAYAGMFNSDLKDWDVSAVTNMSGMFYYTQSFNSDLSKWKVGNVENMELMFYNAGKFNSDLKDWEVTKVTTMKGMFANAVLFNSDLSGWAVNMVKDMSKMFSRAKAFNQDLSAWGPRLTGLAAEKVDQMFIQSGLAGNEPQWYKDKVSP